MKKSRRNGLYRQLVVATLLMGGAFNLAAPVLAAGTAAGTGISNTATATYQDPNDPNNTPIYATSNTVTITVAKVAGVTATSSGISEAPSSVNPSNTNQGNGTINTGDVVYFDYTITNVGNDNTQFFIPGAPSQVQGGTFDPSTAAGQIQIVSVTDPNGNTTATAITVPTAGSLTGSITGTGMPANGSFAAGASVKVRVPIKVTANTSGAPIKVVLGDTGANDNTAGTQNQSYVASTVTAPSGVTGFGNYDIYTQKVTGSNDPVNGDSTNHRQEASVSQQIFLAATPKAFATILNTQTNFQAGTGATSPDGTLTYGLSLRVENSSPDTGFIPADLQGTAVKVDTGTGVQTKSNMILVSDVVPTNTTLVTNNGVVAPLNWTAVYSTDDPATTNPLQATWSTTAPTNATTIKRIGFIYDATTTPIAKGITVNSFSFKVTTNVASNGGTVANLAQVFGQTTNNPADPNIPLVYDESGDQNPDNYDGSTPAPDSNLKPSDFNTSSANNPAERGIATPATQGIDNNNNNTGVGPGGEDNVFSLPATTATILNGPNGQPSAVGPTGNNDDFTNKSVQVPAANSAPGSTIPNPGAITFTNTVQNPTGTAVSNVLLRPNNIVTNKTDLIDGTKVTISLGANSGTYSYSQTSGQFTLLSGTPVSIASLPANTSLNYTVSVQLPNNTPLSTDMNTTTNKLYGGYSVPIVAFTDNNGNGAYDPGTDAGNITIDRVYTGYLKLTKEARILDGNGNQVAPAQANTYTNDPTVLSPASVPGNTIEYRIRYKNISEAASGTGNVVLNASNTVISEDGTLSPNTWFGLTVDPVFPNNPNGSALATAGTITVGPQNGDIQVYKNNLGTVTPSGSTGADNGNFIFRRRIK